MIGEFSLGYIRYLKIKQRRKRLFKWLALKIVSRSFSYGSKKLSFKGSNIGFYVEITLSILFDTPH